MIGITLRVERITRACADAAILSAVELHLQVTHNCKLVAFPSFLCGLSLAELPLDHSKILELLIGRLSVRYFGPYSARPAPDAQVFSPRFTVARFLYRGTPPIRFTESSKGVGMLFTISKLCGVFLYRVRVTGSQALKGSRSNTPNHLLFY